MSAWPSTDQFQSANVLVTGHSGFKGTWLTSWLIELGADVTGFSLPAQGDDTNVLHRTDLGASITEIEGDIRSFDAITSAFSNSEPDLVIHMAAQALVRASYSDPLGTFETNVIGTGNVLEACRQSASVKAVVSVASDKCYENPDSGHPHVEGDPLGGADPYSASKGAAEIITASFRQTLMKESGTLLASMRAGNVLGAGDASQDRIVPDIIRMIEHGGPITLRNPGSVRPWQHVLEPLRGYLMVAGRLLEGDRSAEGSWNIGPLAESAITVEDLTRRFVAEWGTDIEVLESSQTGRPEAKYLRLDTDKARDELGFIPKFSIDDTIKYVVGGYRDLTNGTPLEEIIGAQIQSYSVTA